MCVCGCTAAGIKSAHSLPGGMSRVRIATLIGSLADPGVLLVQLYSMMNPGVHTEIWFDDYVISAGENVFDANGTFLGCVGIWHTRGMHVTSDWHVVDVPITDAQRAWQFIAAAAGARVEYGVSAGECAFPKFVIDAFEGDLDCCRPATWDRLFCSQFVLLFLRWCAVQKILDVPDERSVVLWSVNSRGCLPSRLKILMDMMFEEKATRL